jgi:hypothetical protein
VGQLDEKQFEQTIAGCLRCEHKAFEVSSYIDRKQSVMLGDANDDGRWVHDGEKFIDGVYRIRCLNCSTEAFATDACPRCHRADQVAAALGAMSRLVVPKRCPGCKGTELAITGFAPATVRTGAGRPAAPAPTALFGDAGFHIALAACDGCDWVQAAEGCPICGGPGPLRTRPG